MGMDITVEKREKNTEFAGRDGLTEKSKFQTDNQDSKIGEILFISSFPPRECGIAVYTQNLLNALNNRFLNSFSHKLCAIQPDETKYYYPPEVTSVLNISNREDFVRIAKEINENKKLSAVLIQHEFDLYKKSEQIFIDFIRQISKPVIIVFHSVISGPSEEMKAHIVDMANSVRLIIVLASVSEDVLTKEYGLPKEKIQVIPYGTHLVNPANVVALKEKYKLTGKSVISSIGLLSPGKGIENTLEALPAVIKQHPEVMFLIVGKTHPEELKKEGEKYRIMLEARVKSLKLQNHVQFLNIYSTPEMLLEFFQLSDICIFSCTNPNRPMSSMFSFAVSCGNAIISSPTPHAYEFLGEDSDKYIYKGTNDLAVKINILLDDPALRKTYSDKVLKKSISSIWENSAQIYNNIFDRITGNKLTTDYKYPPIKLDFLKLLTDRTGILQLSYKGEPDLRAGYTLDDNALALFVFCMHFKITGDINDITYIRKYLKFLYHCFQASGEFYKYVDHERKFPSRNLNENLEESQAKAIWALGYLYSMKGLVPSEMTDVAGLMLENSLLKAETFKSPKSIALVIKGMYYYFSVSESIKDLNMIKSLANKLVDMYKTYSTDNWKWFEPKFSASASILPGALLNTWLISGELVYKNIAAEAFEFLSSRMLINNRFDIVSKDDWINGLPGDQHPGEKPCDIAFAVIALSKFYLMCKDNEYFFRMDTAFKWFIGENRLKQMIYNPVSGGCFDGLDSNGVIISQSADSALCYSLARMIVDKYKFNGENHINQII